jgi:hypothetical protein
MEIGEPTIPLFISQAKPLCYSQNEQLIAVGEDSEKIILINKYELKSHFAI